MALNNGRISVRKTGVQTNGVLAYILREGCGLLQCCSEILLEISFVFFMSYLKSVLGKFVVVFQIADLQICSLRCQEGGSRFGTLHASACWQC